MPRKKRAPRKEKTYPTFADAWRSVERLRQLCTIEGQVRPTLSTKTPELVAEAEELLVKYGAKGHVHAPPPAAAESL